MNTRWHDLIVDRLKDGGIHLEQQSGLQEPSVIHLHPQQLRHVAEQFGLVAPNYPDDELSKRLAERICRVFLAMSDDYRHLSHVMEAEFNSLDGFIDALPDAVFPFHLWDEREALERKKESEHNKRATKAQQAPQMPERSAADGVGNGSAENDAHGQQMGLAIHDSPANGMASGSQFALRTN